jgi:uncharacterized RDD family membrane protein YckC
MQCPSCGAISENSDWCADCTATQIPGEEPARVKADPSQELKMSSGSDTPTQPQPKRSTLIEFPGVMRTSVPEWRKELSERVREVQERRARDAAREAADVERHRLEAAPVAPQLELLPAAEMPAMNPLVAAALRRIERAHQTVSPEIRQPRNSLATAVAYVPACEESEPETLSVPAAHQLVFEDELEPEIAIEPDPLPQVDKTHSLVVVPVAEIEASKPEVVMVPKRLIFDDPNDPALNYLDSISRTVLVDEVDARRSSALRRLFCALLDLIICGALCVPIAFAMRATGAHLQDLRTIGILAGCVVVVTFIYLTLATALTGRTLAMRLLSLSIIDTKTGLIPTGGQSVGRSFLYLISLATGVGLLFALVSREGYTAHDRITRTAVIIR